MKSHEALLYEPGEDLAVRCQACAHRCLVQPGRAGICGVRANQGGRLVSLVYGRAVSVSADPIEKKPLFHFFPGTTSLSIATAGCNFACSFCQNYSISQLRAGVEDIPGRQVSPEEVVQAALDAGARSIAYTYTEPTVFLEYALDTARLAHAAGLKNVFVTNGYMTEEAAGLMEGLIDAANVDLKAMNDVFYREQCKARRTPVMETIERLHKMGLWVEVTTLLIPGLNDDSQELEAMAFWLAGISTSIPWHLSRFHPTFRLLDRPATPAVTIERARAAGLAAGLEYVYSGNLWGDEGEKTFCHHCQALLIDRRGFQVAANRVKNGACPECGVAIAGVGV